VAPISGGVPLRAAGDQRSSASRCLNEEPVPGARGEEGASAKFLTDYHFYQLFGTSNSRVSQYHDYGCVRRLRRQAGAGPNSLRVTARKRSQGLTRWFRKVQLNGLSGLRVSTPLRETIVPAARREPRPGVMKSDGCRAELAVTILRILLRRHSQASGPSPQPSPKGRGSQYLKNAMDVAAKRCSRICCAGIRKRAAHHPSPSLREREPVLFRSATNAAGSQRS
jgi:hypothetical protein